MANKQIRRLFRIVVVALMAAYVLLLCILNVPFTRQRLKTFAEDALTETLAARVEIGDLRIGLFNRATLTDVCIHDQLGDTLLKADRISAKIALRSLLQAPLTLRTVSLMDARIRIYRPEEGAPLNAQFILDAFQSQEKEQKAALDLRIGSLILRNCAFTYDERFRPQRTGTLDVAHLDFSHIDANLSLRRLTDERLSLRVRSLSLREKCGFRIDDFAVRMQMQPEATDANRQCLTLADFRLRLPHSEISFASLPVCFSLDADRHVLPASLTAAGEWHGVRIALQDVLPLLPFAGEGLPVSPSALQHLTLGLDAVFTHNGDGTEVQEFALRETSENLFAVEGDFSLGHENLSLEKIDFSLRKISLNAEKIAALRISEKVSPKVSEILRQTASVDGEAEGVYFFREQSGEADIALHTAVGDVEAELEMARQGRQTALSGEIGVKGIALQRLLADETLPDDITATVEGKVVLQDGGGIPAAEARLLVEEATWRNYRYTELEATFNTTGTHYALTAASEHDANLRLALSAAFHLPSAKDLRSLEVDEFALDVPAVAPQALHWTSLFGENALAVHLHAADRQIRLRSTLADLDYEGPLHFESLVHNGRSLTAALFPSLGLAENHSEAAENHPESAGNHSEKTGSLPETAETVNVKITVHPSDVLQALVGDAAEILSPIAVEAKMQDGDDLFAMLTASTQQLGLANDTLRGVSFFLRADRHDAQMLVQAQKQFAGTATHIEANVQATPSHASDSTLIRTQVFFAPHVDGLSPSEVHAETLLSLQKGATGLTTRFIPSTLRLSDDDEWQIASGTVVLKSRPHEEKKTFVSVENFSVARPDGSAQLYVDGELSGLPDDSIVCNLRQIDVGYVMNLVNFHAVDFSGKASGRAVMHGSLKDLVVDADISMPSLFLNGHTIGRAHITGGYLGEEKKILLHALLDETPEIYDQYPCLAPFEPRFGYAAEETSEEAAANISPEAVRENLWLNPSHSEVHGYVSLKEKGLLLNVSASRLRLDFLQRYVDGIFNDFSARASGGVILYGPFKQLHFGGSVSATAHAQIPATGVTYDITAAHVALSPEAFTFTDVEGRAFQENAEASGTSRNRRQTAGKASRPGFVKGEGRLSHTFFKNICYDFTLEATDLLLYDQSRSFDLPFYATAFGTGTAHLYGSPGSFAADLSLTPTAGTEFTYIVDTPTASDDVPQMIEFRDKERERLASGTPQQAAAPVVEEEKESSTGILLNFNLNLNPQAALRIITDEKSGDHMLLYGNGAMRASFYNKGAFTLYGTYTIERGTYSLAVQDIIRKELKMRSGSSLTFTGPPMQGQLGLRAAYTVPAASLADLGYSAGFSKRTARVDVLLDITGHPTAPQVGFDLDVQGISEEEQQMLRTLLSTEQDIHRQALYLLGVGRFFPTSGANASADALNPGASAASSLLSSTLSSQLNHALRSAMGSSAGRWSFGTNFNTGELGWSDLEVDGSISGSLLNDRLLIGGQFGYRENTYSTSNFVGDFDLQYLLTRSGTIRLRAYSETNDRYFTRTSLTTQGIGINLNRSFSKFPMLFRRAKRKDN